MGNTSGVSFAGEITLTKLNITSANPDDDNKFDIRLLFTEMELYEDIFSNSISGTLVMSENFNLITGLPITGEEYIEMEFHSNAFPDEVKTVSKIFFVYKVSKRVVSNQKKNNYVIHFISQEAVTNMTTRMSRAFSGYGQEIITAVYNEQFKDYTTNKLNVEESSNYIKFVSNYWSPFKCINYATSRSTDKTSYQVPTFLFYEDKHSFNFKSLNSLYKNKPVTEYFYDKNPLRIDMGSQNSGESIRDIDREFKTAKSMNIDYTTDFIQRITSGAYGHRMFSFDILNKTFNYNSYNYISNFNDSNHLETHPMASPFTIDGVNNARIDTNVSMPFVHNTFKVDNSSDIILKRLSLLSQTELYKVELTVPGRPDVEVGDIVKFNMLDYASVNNDIPAGTVPTGDLTDKYYSGNYLISAIYHRITFSRHEMKMQLIKDSIVSQLSYKDTI